MHLLAEIEKWAREQPDIAAIVFGDKTLTFSKLVEDATTTSTILAAQYHVKPGDRVAYLGLNHPDMLLLLIACERLRAIFTPFNSRLAKQEYDFLLEDAKPVVCFYDHNFEQIVDELKPNNCRMEKLYHLHDVEKFSIPEIKYHDANDPLLLVYTSGTTGRPKGVLLSRKAVKSNIGNCNELYDFGPGDRIQITLPLFHVGGLCILLLPALTNGATIHLHASFDPVETLLDIETNAITTSIFVPAQMSAMMAGPNWTERDLSSLKYVAVGSSIIPLQQIRNFHARGIPVSQIYGATETGPAAIGLAIADATENEGSAGKPVKNCNVEVRAPDGQICTHGTNGEIWVKGDNILSGYWNNPEETNKVLINGWYNTGDIGHVDASGFYWIVDRAKDMIISGGENIYPAEVEAISIDHPAIMTIAVVGKNDERWGETPVAAVELNEGQSLSLEDYHEYLKPRLARYKQPKSIIIYEQLPRNGMGKIEKSIIRQHVNQTTD